MSSAWKYKCRSCPKSYSYKESLKRHEMAAHLGLFPYSCSVCGRGFQNKDNMLGHLSHHTGGKSFKCPQCDAAFKWRASLDNHIKKFHEK